jgi:hypothetical protein
MMDVAQASFPTRLKEAERSLRQQRDGLFEAVRQDPDFVARNITLYDFDSLDNVEAIVRLFDERSAAHLDRITNRTMIDIGCANGELGFAFEEAGFSVALLDKSLVSAVEGSPVRQDAPLIASIIARNKSSRAVIFDENIDVGFDPSRVIEGFARAHPGEETFERFGLGVMLGVLYHLKNPYSVVEALRQLCDHLVIGTWVADCLPENKQRIIEDEQVVYLLKDRQLSVDPTNFWIFTPRSFRVMAERCGWRVLSEHSMTNPLPDGAEPRNRLARYVARRTRRSGVSPPDNVRTRVFMLLQRSDLDPPS